MKKVIIILVLLLISSYVQAAGEVITVDFFLSNAVDYRFVNGHWEYNGLFGWSHVSEMGFPYSIENKNIAQTLSTLDEGEGLDVFRLLQQQPRSDVEITGLSQQKTSVANPATSGSQTAVSARDYNDIVIGVIGASNTATGYNSASGAVSSYVDILRETYPNTFVEARVGYSPQRQLSELFPKILSYNPNVIIFSPEGNGINSPELYEQALKKMIVRAKELNIKTIVLTVSPRTNNQEVIAFNTRLINKKLDIPESIDAVVDIFPLLGNNNGCNKCINDGLHWTTEGDALVANALLQELGKISVADHSIILPRGSTETAATGIVQRSCITSTCNEVDNVWSQISGLLKDLSPDLRNKIWDQGWKEPQHAVKSTELTTAKLASRSSCLSVYTPNSPEAKTLFVEAAIEANLPTDWANSEALHFILQEESNGRVGVPNFQIKGRDGKPLSTQDPSTWQDIYKKIRLDEQIPGVTSRATGLGQLQPANIDLYYPSGREGIGDCHEEAIGMLKYIKARYGTPERARAYWNDHHYY